MRKFWKRNEKFKIFRVSLWEGKLIRWRPWLPSHSSSVWLPAAAMAKPQVLFSRLRRKTSPATMRYTRDPSPAALIPRRKSAQTLRTHFRWLQNPVRFCFRFPWGCRLVWFWCMERAIWLSCTRISSMVESACLSSSSSVSRPQIRSKRFAGDDRVYRRICTAEIEGSLCKPQWIELSRTLIWNQCRSAISPHPRSHLWIHILLKQKKQEQLFLET